MAPYVLLWGTLAWGGPIHAQDAVLRGTTLVYVSANGQELVGHDVPTGTTRWRAPLGDAAKAAVISVLDGDVVMVQAARAFTSVDTTSGEVVLRREAPPGWRFVHRGMGGCGLVDRCELQPIDCSDGAPLGPVRHGPDVKFWFDGEHSDPVCTDEPEVLAAATGITIARVTSDEGSQLVGLRRDGQAWSAAEASCENCEPIGAGAAPDGSVCWTTEQDSERKVKVKAFSCSTGQLRFTQSVPVARRNAYVGVVVGWWPEGLLVVHDKGAVALDLQSGAERWRTTLASGQLGVVDGLRVPDWPLDLAASALVTLDPSTGAVLRRSPVPKGELVSFVDQRLVVEPPGRSGGRGGGNHRPPLERFTFERSKEGSRALLGDEVVRAWPKDAWVVGELVHDEQVWLVVNEVTGSIDRLHVLSR